MLLLAATGGLLRSPAPPPGDRFSRRAALQTTSTAALLAAAPQVAFALGSEDKFDGPDDRFEAIRTAAAAAILTEKGSASVFSNKFGKLTLQPNKENFLYEAKSLCSMPNMQVGSAERQLTARLWRPVGKTTAQDIVVAFGTKLVPRVRGNLDVSKLPDGFRFYYGAVVTNKAGEELALFANVFDNEEGRDAFAAMALDFAKKNLQGKAELVEITAGLTPEPAYKYVC